MIGSKASTGLSVLRLWRYFYRFVRGLLTACSLLFLMMGATARSDVTRLTMKSAKASTSYYAMMVQLSEVIKVRSEGTIQPTVEESQGSIQNVREALARSGNFLFTSPSTLIDDARNRQGAFLDYEGNGLTDPVRSLFVMPSTTVHFVVSERSGIRSMAGLAGKNLIPGGVGSFCEQRSKAVLKALGLDGRVNTVSVEISAASGALRNRKVDGFISCSSYPSPQISELAGVTPVRLLSLTSRERNRILALDSESAPVTIPARTYRGQSQDIETVGTPVGAYVTTQMDDHTAYRITRAFWEWKDGAAGKNSWWKAVRPEQINRMGARVHRGALRYYDETGVTIPATML